MSGWIKDYRQELESNIWLMPPLYHRVWQWLKYNVNRISKEIPMRDGSVFTVNPGQRMTSVRHIAKGIGWYEGVKWKEPNPKTISVILVWLEKNKMISINRDQGNRQYTLITIDNWELYQQKENEGNAKVTAGKQCVDINKNDKEINKNIIVKIVDLYHEKCPTLPRVIVDPNVKTRFFDLLGGYRSIVV